MGPFSNARVLLVLLSDNKTAIKAIKCPVHPSAPFSDVDANEVRLDLQPRDNTLQFAPCVCQSIKSYEHANNWIHVGSRSIHPDIISW